MGTNQRFHQSNKYYLERIPILLSKGIDSGRINERDRELIEEFIAEIVAVSQITPIRRYKLVGTLIRIREHLLTPYADSTIADVYTAIDNIKGAIDGSEKPRYTAHTLHDYLRMLKRFFVWMSENEYTSINPTKLKKINVPRPNGSPITAEMILTEEEIKAIIEATTTSRDRALISVLYEGGFRIGEIANMRWCDVKFTDWGVTINTAEKTGKPRYVALASSRACLLEWKNDYPLPITDSAFVFLTTTTKQPLQYQGLVKQIRKLADRAGVKKYIKPHIFRHSRVTHLIQQGMNESTVKLMMWGDVTTDMLKVYQHLTNRDIDNEVAKLNGFTIEGEDGGKTKRRAMKPVQCPRCAKINHPTMKYCGNCGTPLTTAEISTAENMEKELVSSMTDNPAFMMELFNAMQELADKHDVSLPFGGEDATNK